MAPSVQVDDYILVETTPVVRRCDIVIYRVPAPAGTPEVDYIRRIIGLPGDQIAYVGGRLRFNGQVASRERVESGDHVTIYRETLPSGCSYLIQEMDDYRIFDNTAEVTVPPGTFYGLGDNRDDAMDSRVPTVGPIPIENIIGSAVLIYWAKDRSRIGVMLTPSEQSSGGGDRTNGEVKPRTSSSPP